MAATKKKVTKEIYTKLKAMLKTPADDQKVMEESKLSAKTVRDIRNTKDYQGYCERRFRFNGNPKCSNTGKKKAKVEVDKDTEKELDELIQSAKDGDKAIKSLVFGDPKLPHTSITIIGGNISIMNL